MKAVFKPAGYNSVSPYLIVNDAPRLVTLLKEVFDATELRRYNRPDGSIMHMEMKIDDSVIMLSDATEQFKAMLVVMHVYVADADTVFQKAIDAGCTILEKPLQKENDPDKRGTFTDFAGNMWSVSTQLLS